MAKAGEILNLDTDRVYVHVCVCADFLKECFGAIQEPRHPVTIKVEVNGVRQPEQFHTASISHSRQVKASLDALSGF